MFERQEATEAPREVSIQTAEFQRAQQNSEGAQL
jgi:hypothetical protein